VQKPARNGPASRSGQRQSHKAMRSSLLTVTGHSGGQNARWDRRISASCSNSLGLRHMPEIGRVLDYSIVNDLRNILRQQMAMRAASRPPDYATNEVPPPSGFGTFSMTFVPPARWRETRSPAVTAGRGLRLWPAYGRASPAPQLNCFHRLRPASSASASRLPRSGAISETDMFQSCRSHFLRFERSWYWGDASHPPAPQTAVRQ